MIDIRNPYPGPRPLTEADAQRRLLKGRESDLGQLSQLLTGHRKAIVLTAESGMGKTSLIQAGLIPHLRAAGYAVCYFDKWRVLTSSTGSGNIIQALRESNVGEDLQTEWQALLDAQQTPARAFGALKSKFGSKLIVVFDQLEELFRLDPDLGREFIGSLVRLLNSSGQESPRWLVSLRREFVFEMVEFERKLQFSDWKRMDLEPIELDAVSSIVIDPLVQSPWGLESDCAVRIADAWKVAAFGTADDEVIYREGVAAKVGLIHLQAFLWAMWEQVDSSKSRPAEHSALSWQQITDVLSQAGWLVEALNADERPAGSADLPKRYREAFQDSLAVYVRLRLGALRSECAQHSPQIANETLACAAELSPRLSSGTYKLIVDVDDLALDAPVGFEILDLGETNDVSQVDAHRGGRGISVAKKIVQAVRQICITELTDADQQAWGGVIRPEDPGNDYQRCIRKLLEAPDLYGLELAGEDLQGAQSTPERLKASGRMRDQRPIRIALELAVTYCRSLLWLEQAHLVRFTPGLQQRSKSGSFRELSVSAIHDGFGVALRRWGESASTEPIVCASQLVALRGEQVLRQPRSLGSSARRLVAGRPDDPFVFENAVWQGCIITADLQNVSFRNCDLRGLLFHDCDFDNVSFEDCITWGLLIQRSRIFGAGVKFSASSRSEEASVKGLTFQNGCVFGPRTSLLPAAEGGFAASGDAREEPDGCREADPGLAVPLLFEGLSGYGLFLSGTQGAHWELRDCDLIHVSIGYTDDEDRDLGQGPVAGTGAVFGGDIQMATVGAFTGSVVGLEASGSRHIVIQQMSAL